MPSAMSGTRLPHRVRRQWVRNVPVILRNVQCAPSERVYLCGKIGSCSGLPGWTWRVVEGFIMVRLAHSLHLRLGVSGAILSVLLAMRRSDRSPI